MYVFTKEDETLVFMDMFGLTRLTFPKKIKTDRNQQGSLLFSSMSMDESNSILYTYRPFEEMAALWGLPALKVAQKFKRYKHTKGTLSPDGRRIIYVDGFTLKIDLYSGSDECVEVDLTPASGVPRYRYLQAVPAPIVFGEEGRFVFFKDGVLIEGVLDGDCVDVKKTMVLPVGERGYIQLFLGEDTVYVVVNDAGTSVVYNSESGAVHEYNSLTPAQVVNGHVVYQPDESHVIREHLVSQGREVFELAEEDRGIAHIFVGSTKLVILPWHRGEVVDLVSGERVSRKFKGEMLEASKKFTWEAQKLVRSAHVAGGWIDWCDFNLNKNFPLYGYHFILQNPGSIHGEMFSGVVRSFWHGKTMGNDRKRGAYGSQTFGSDSADRTLKWTDDEFKAQVEGYFQAGCTKENIHGGVRELSGIHISDEALQWFNALPSE